MPAAVPISGGHRSCPAGCTLTGLWMGSATRGLWGPWQVQAQAAFRRSPRTVVGRPAGTSPPRARRPPGDSSLWRASPCLLAGSPDEASTPGVRRLRWVASDSPHHHVSGDRVTSYRGPLTVKAEREFRPGAGSSLCLMAEGFACREGWVCVSRWFACAPHGARPSSAPPFVLTRPAGVSVSVASRLYLALGMPPAWSGGSLITALGIPHPPRSIPRFSRPARSRQRTRGAHHVDSRFR